MGFLTVRNLDGSLQGDDGSSVPWEGYYPPYTGKPGPGTVGARGVLTPYYGNLSIGSNQTVEGLDIYGRVDFTGANSVLRRCRVRNVPAAQQLSGYGMVNALGTGVSNNLVDECTLWSDEVGQNSAGVEGRNITVRRCEIYGVVDAVGAKWVNNNGVDVNVVVEDNWMHGFIFTESTNHADGYTHNDGVQIHTGGGVAIRRNFIDATDIHPESTTAKPAAITSCVIFNGTAGYPWGTIEIRDNWLSGAVAHVNGGAGNITSLTLLMYDNICSNRKSYELVLNPKFTAEMAPGLPTSTGQDVNNGNYREGTSTPITVHRVAA